MTAVPPEAHQPRTVEVKKQIGNAVPVGIARWFGQQVGAALGLELAA